MKLTDLDHTGGVDRPIYRQLPLNLPEELYDLLADYREHRQASGFIRLATLVLLALTGNGVDIERAADELFISCETEQDVIRLCQELNVLAHEIESRL